MLSKEQQKLVEDNINLIYYFIYKYKKYTLDLVDVGYIGLCKAALTFDKSKNIKFATYASRCILNAFNMQLRRDIKITQHEVMSLDKTLYNDDEDNQIDIIDLIPSNHNTEREVFFKDMQDKLYSYLYSIKERDRDILISYLINNESQLDISRNLNMHQPTVSRLIRKHLNKFRTKYYSGLSYKDIEEELYNGKGN